MSNQPARSETYWSDLAEQADRDSEQDAARWYGMKAEEYGAERFDMGILETGYSDLVVPYDHPLSDREKPSGPHSTRYPGNRRLVQVKGARLKIKRSGGGRAGRFRLWEPDHVRLVEGDDVYLFLGYEPAKSNPVTCVRFIEARDLSDAVGGLNWYDASHSTKDGRPTDLNVKRIFPHL